MAEKWKKCGRIYCPDGSVDWMNNSVLTPQPFLLNDEVIRIYGCFRDKDGVGRIGFLDVSAADPKKILRISDKPVVALGGPGEFDDNGMLLGDVLRVGDTVRMYYVAFQHVQKAKFFAFSGCAISEDGGETFKRYSRVPIMDRQEEGIFGRCIHTVLKDGDIFKIWYSVIYDWKVINGIPYPVYDIKYVESADGLHVSPEGVQCIRCRDDEYRIGRPRVRKLAPDFYEMRYTFDTVRKEYKTGYAESSDGIHWTRKDELGWLTAGPEAWDAEMACYPVVLKTKYGTYMFYDGNGMGRDGFGYARLED